jgi:membrane protease YdiL (CAAX protease family)
MTLSLTLALVWLVLANILALIPSRDNHWSRAYLLIALGVPLLGYVTYENGPWIGLLLLAAGASILRWPVIYLGRWLRRVMRAERP